MHRHGAGEVNEDEVKGWFAGRIPEGWFTEAPEVTFDREEILVIGRLEDVEAGEGATEGSRTSARSGRIKRFREETRDARIQIAREAEGRFGRKVSWGARCADTGELFTTLAMPMMTRLRMEDRKVLDTLVEAGVARSRSHALAWCVRLVGENQAEWIQNLRQALEGVEQARSEGPTVV